MSIVIDCFGDSHVGRHRPANEDQYLIADLNKSMRVHRTSLGLSHPTRLFGGSQGKLLLVADGLGGHESGERASTLAVDGIANYLLNAMDWLCRANSQSEDKLIAELKRAFAHSQLAVEVEADAIPQRRGMGTTLTLGYIDWPNLYVVHVGDTRCYHVRDDSLKQLTTDHTIAELSRVASNDQVGSESKQDTQVFNPMGHALWNVVGGNDRSLEPEIIKETLEVGDSLLLCSDGLTRYVKDSELLQLIQIDQPANQTCTQMIEMANQRGGKDNTTVVLARFVEQCADVESATASAVIENSESTNLAPTQLAK